MDILSILSKTDLGPAAKTLVEKISDAVGAGWQPLGRIWNAWADVKVDEIKAEGEVKVDATRRRAIERVIAEETRKQENLEAMYGKTFAFLEASTDPETIRSLDNDWLVYHSEKARLVSDDEMQFLWAKILALEANKPGSFNRRCLNLLSVLDKQDAESFTSLCRFVVHDFFRPHPVVLFRDGFLQDVYTQNKISHDILTHLDTIGLIRFSTPMLADNVWYYDVPKIQLQYFEEARIYRLSIYPKTAEYWLGYGAVGLTDLGEQLSRIAGATPIPGFFDHLEVELGKSAAALTRLH